VESLHSRIVQLVTKLVCEIGYDDFMPVQKQFIYLFIYYMVYTHVKSFTIVKKLVQVVLVHPEVDVGMS